MKSKITIILLFVTLVCLAGNVQAISKTINDDIGDVYDGLELKIATPNENFEINNVDISQYSYDIEGSTVTMSLLVEGLIEKRGSFDEFKLSEGDVDDITDIFSISYDLVLYSFYLETQTLSGDSIEYTIIYINDECNVTIGTLTDISYSTVTSFEVISDMISITFELQSSQEVYVSSKVATGALKLDLSQIDLYDEDQDISEFGFYVYEDGAEDTPIDLDIGGPYTGTTDESISFSPVVEGGTEPYDYYWDFGDGESATGKNPTHTYTKADEYTVSLEIIDDAGYTASALTLVTISNNNNGNNGDSHSSNLLLFGVIIAIIAIAGVGVIIYILRR